MLIGVPLETAAGETRVAVTPETAKKLKAQGHTLRVQSGAGLLAAATDEAYVAVGAEITDAAGAFGCRSEECRVGKVIASGIRLVLINDTISLRGGRTA